MKVLLRSQSNFISPVSVHSRRAHGDTKGRSISIADGVERRRKLAELTLICVINQTIETGELCMAVEVVLVLVEEEAANGSQCGCIKSAY